MKTNIAIISIIILSGCAAQRVTPVIDSKRMSAQQQQSYNSDLQECRALGKEASIEGSGMALLGALAGNYQRSRAIEEKERIVVSECLKGRGHRVVY